MLQRALAANLPNDYMTSAHRAEIYGFMLRPYSPPSLFHPAWTGRPQLGESWSLRE